MNLTTDEEKLYYYLFHSLWWTKIIYSPVFETRKAYLTLTSMVEGGNMDQEQ